MDIRSRKKEHLESARKRDVEYSFPAGFDDVRFVHDSLPETDMAGIDCSASLFGKALRSPDNNRHDWRLPGR